MTFSVTNVIIALQDIGEKSKNGTISSNLFYSLCVMVVVAVMTRAFNYECTLMLSCHYDDPHQQEETIVSTAKMTFPLFNVTVT